MSLAGSVPMNLKSNRKHTNHQAIEGNQANSNSAGQEIPHLIRSMEVHYCVNKNLPLAPIEI
jgi:hypothetical protein